MKKLIAFVIIAMLCGCAGANISSQIRESGEQGSSKMIRCIDLSTGNLAADSKTGLKQFDGWKMVYTSEYTTGNKVASAVVMCFEKPYVE